MMLVKKLFVIYLERERLDNMWKVLVIICMAGYDCTAFQQSPMQYYHDYDECVSVAIEKEKQLTQFSITYFNLVKNNTIIKSFE